MSRDISIAVSAKDNFSQAINTMRNAGIHFNKNLEEMQIQLNGLNRTRATLRLDTKDAQQNLQNIQKEYLAAKKSGEGMISDEMLKRLNEANEAYEQARRNLGLVDKAARDTEKSMASVAKAQSKSESKAGAMGSFVSTLAASGALKMAGDLTAGLADAIVGSSQGDIGSLYFSSALSSALSGAAIGNMIVPGVGAVVGGAIGTLTGFANAGIQQYKNEDEAFKSAVQEQYNTISGRRAEELSTGTSIAAQRELDKIAFDKILKGDSTGTLEAVKTMANTTPFLYEDLKGITKTLATYGTTDPEAIKKRLTQIGDTGAALGMSSADMSMVATGLGRMQSSGKTTLEYLNLLIERESRRLIIWLRRWVPAIPKFTTWFQRG